MKALTHWRHYLGWTKTPFTILTDHANLQYWKAPQILNQRTAQWHADLQEYNFVIKHIPGKINTPADELSHPPNSDQEDDDNTDPRFLQKESHDPHPRPPYSRTSRTRQDDSKSYGNPTMDRDVAMNRRL